MLAVLLGKVHHSISVSEFVEMFCDKLGRCIQMGHDKNFIVHWNTGLATVA